MQLPYTQKMQDIGAEIDRLMHDFCYSKKDIGYGRRWTFANGMWFDLIDYKRKDTIIFRVGRGAWLVRKYPILYTMFDQVLTVIAKFEVHSVATLHEKHVVGLFSLLDQAPSNIGALE